MACIWRNFFLNHFLLQLVLRRIFCLFDSLISVLGVTYDLETSYYFVREWERECVRERGALFDDIEFVL